MYTCRHMKIAFVGKGGSGKTTVSSLLSRYLADAGFPTIAIDADINQHLGTMLGMPPEDVSSMPHMGIEMVKIKEYLRGSNPRITRAEDMIKTTPPGTGSRMLSVQEENEIYTYFSRVIHGVRLMAVGAFNEDDLGVRCYHSKTGSVELLLNHLIDTEGEYVIVDMTAGADEFASGLFTRFDVTFLVVEPTTKSVSVYEQYKKYARDHDVVIKVIGNKVEDDSDDAFLRQAVGDDLIATLHMSPFVKKIDRGETSGTEKLETRNEQALVSITSFIDTQEKNWEKFYRQAVEFHKKNAEGWANEATGINLSEQIDPDFTLTQRKV